MLTLYSIPTTNSSNNRITLMNGGAIVATLDAGAAATLTVDFDQIGIHNPPHQPVVRDQNPPVAVGVLGVHPGNIAYVSDGPGPVTHFSYAMPGGQQRTVNFT